MRRRNGWFGLIGCALLAGGGAGAAEMTPPATIPVVVQWNAVDAAAAGLPALPGEPAGAADDASPPAPSRLERLNTLIAGLLPGVPDSPVPVLMPFDLPAYLRDLAAGPIADPLRYTPSAPRGEFFQAGPAGYDAVITLRQSELATLGISFAEPVPVLITGAAFRYDLPPAHIRDATPVKALQRDLPDLQRILLESRVRYVFTRFGVPYAVSLYCFDGRARARRLSCRDADKVALRVINALHLVGGRPQTAGPALPAIDRPPAVSPTFTYHPPGDLIPGTGRRGQSGVADTTVYARIRFPIKDAPAYANSQSFMNWGDCNFTGRVNFRNIKGASYACRVNGRPLVFDEGAGGNYTYPWRDNFCETRDFYVGQCLGGLGHQGQDIRPSVCAKRNDGADRCLPDRADVVAVRDGMILRPPGDQAVHLIVNAPGEHLRFRYLHLNPQALDAAGMVTGRRVREGEVIGQVSNFNRRPGGTTYHLHFDMQVPGPDGWVFVNPYMTLVAAYERLIGGRGTVVTEPAPPLAPVAAPAPEPEQPAATAAVEGDDAPGEAPAVVRKVEPRTPAFVASRSCARRHLSRRARRACAAEARAAKTQVRPHGLYRTRAKAHRLDRHPGRKLHRHHLKPRHKAARPAKRRHRR